MKQAATAFFIFILFNIHISAQQEPEQIYAAFQSYKLIAITDENHESALSLYSGNNKLSTLSFDASIETLQVIDFNRDGKPVIVVKLYSGGAHCCTSIKIFTVTNNTLVFLCALDFGNSGVEIKDLDKDGRMELVSNDDRFAYQFGSFASTRAFICIYRLENNSLVLSNLKFRVWIQKDIEKLKIELEQFLDNGAAICEEEYDKELFQSLLGAITGAYATLGEERKGYDLINRFYLCSDKDKYISKLQSLLAINRLAEKK